MATATDISILEAQKREPGTKNAARRVRVDGKIPAVVYGAGKSAASIAVDPRQVLRILRSESGHNTIFDLALDSDRHVGWLVAYALLFGLGFGARGPIITAMASDLFGGRRFGLIYGALSVGNGIGGAIGPWFGGVVHDVMGSYRVVFLTSMVFCAVGSGCFWLAGRRSP